MPLHWTDGHLDLAWLALEGRDLAIHRPAGAGGVSLPDLADANVDLIFATIFTAPRQPQEAAGPERYGTADEAHLAGIKQLDVYRSLASQARIRLITTAEEVSCPGRGADAAEGTNGPIDAVLLMENADPIRTPEEAQQWFDAGVRIVGLAWAPGSRYAGGNATAHGLSPEGRRIAAEFDRIGMIHDASHLSDAAFADLLSCTSGPLIASHSNCRAIAGASQRHLSDEQIAALSARGGVIGLNLFGKFLVPPGERSAATITDCLRHLSHVESITGTRKILALGSDMDGGFPPISLPEGIRSPRDYEKLADALAGAGWSDEEIAGFAGGNWRRFLHAHLPGK